MFIWLYAYFTLITLQEVEAMDVDAQKEEAGASSEVE